MRETEYATVVEMDPEVFRTLNKQLNDPDRSVRRAVEMEINKLIKPEHWQDDDVLRIDDFEPA